MAGKLYLSYGSHFAGTESINRRNPGSRLVRAYAEGRNAKAAGALQTANPHAAGTPANGAWDFGWSNKNTGTPKDHCAV